MNVFRIEKEKYLPTMLEGMGGKLCSFRWNTKGHPIIYAAAAKSLALIEKSGNMSRPSYGIPAVFKLVTLVLPDHGFRQIAPDDLSKGWNQFDHYAKQTQEIGDHFVESSEFALFVPSSIVPGEFNVLINPKAPEISQITWSWEEIDSRLIDGR